MLVDVTLLRSKGLRLRPSELQPPTRGFLTVDYASAEHCSFRRPVLTANLQMPQSSLRSMVSVLSPIFEVHLMPMKDWKFSIAGTELESIQTDKDRRVREHQQIWRCMVVLDASVPPERQTVAVTSLDSPAPDRLIPPGEMEALGLARRCPRGTQPD